MKNINRLLKKYEDGKYVHGAYKTPKQDRERYFNKRLKERYQIFDKLLLEAPRLNLSTHEKQRVKYLIKYYNTSFKKLYSRGSDELIILAFIFHVKIASNYRIKINEWSICKNYNLNQNNFSIILINMLELIFKNTPLRITETTRYDHSLLEKTTIL